MTGSLNFKITCAIHVFLNVYIFKTLIQFNRFLSQPMNILSTNENYAFNTTVQQGANVLNLPIWSHSLVSNIFLIQIFYVQHSLLKNTIEQALQNNNMEYLARSVFNILSAMVLQIIMQFWSPITAWALWNFPLESNSWTEWAIWTIRSLTWTILLCECVLLDISDLLGWKQIVHHFNHLPPPSFIRSSNLNLTLENMRHPGLLELLILLWVTPTLSLDRLVFSGLLSMYVVLGFKGQCTHYVTQERERKWRELDALVKPSPSKRVRFKLPEKEGETNRSSEETDNETDGEETVSSEKRFDPKGEVHCRWNCAEKGRN